MKYLGSKFCQGCGRLFQLTAPGERRCADCQQPGEPAVAAPPVPAEVPAPVKEAAKPAPPKTPAPASPQPDDPGTAPALAGSVEVRVTEDDLAQLDAGQIKAVFAGVGSVLAAAQKEAPARRRRSPNTTPAMRKAGEYWIICCAHCRHPGGGHVIEQWEPRISRCRYCSSCPGYIDGDYGVWSNGRKPLPPEPVPAPAPAPAFPRSRAANQGTMPRLPAGLVGTCLLVLGIQDKPMSAADVRAWLEREGDHYTEIQVHYALHALGRTDRHYRRPPLAEIKEKRDGAAYWQPTEYGRGILTEDEDEEG